MNISNSNSKIGSSVSNHIKSSRIEASKLQNNQNAQLGKPTLVDSIISTIKEKTNKNLQMYIMVAIPLLCLLAFLYYKYNVSSQTNDVITNMGYKKKITLQPLSQCYTLDAKLQYKLCDYYISSSFMTPCIGNQHYDYISNDMIAEVIQSGARYIQIPICEADVSLQSLPVVGTAVYGQRVITSLNTLEIKSVFKTISLNAFKINNKATNYPLIIHLILHTTNAFTLKNVADNISEVLGNVLIDASQYKTIPIFLEKLCNLQDKIILFATPQYIGTKLEPFIVPTSKLFESYHFSELGLLNTPADTVYKTSYNQNLSFKQQKQSNINFKNKYPTINYIVSNINTIGDTIINDTDILNNLTCFNKVGISVVKPHYPEDVISLNYDPSEAIYYGCQITAMNFQKNDSNMQSYLEIFKDSSFRLKPDSLRFSEVEEPIQDLLKVYQSVIQKDDNIINDFYYRYNNCLIAFEAYSLPNTYLTQIETNLRFNLGTNQIKDKTSNITYKIGINQCFIPRKSNISSSNNISVYLESASMTNQFISMNSNFFDLQELSRKKQQLLNQALYIVKPKTVDNSNDGEMISIRTADDDTPMYIAFENKLVKAYANIPQVEALNNMTFKIHKIAFRYVIKFITIYDGSLKTMGEHLIGVLENNTTDGTSYYIIPANNDSSNNNKNFNIFIDQFVLQNKDTKTYVEFDPNTLFLYDREIHPTHNGTFNIVLKNGYYTILNVNNDNLMLVGKNLIKFGRESDVTTNEDLFKIDVSYELI